jgi:SEC-C motif
MDLAQRTIANLEKLKADPTAFTLAKAVESQISEAEWTKLRNLYFAVKQHQTEHANPNQIDAHFPPEVLAGNGSMVGYYEILPYARLVELTLGADTWLLDDQYCVSPTCPCREAVLSFVPLRPFTGADWSPIDPSLSLRYAYDTGRIEAPPAAGALGLSGQDFLNALRSAQLDLNSLLAKRHVFLRHLFRRALSRRTLCLPTAKPGRNDPCPCGSGKKYKRCCGAS